MNILLINHYAGSPHHGMEFRPYYLAREWVRMGHKVKIVAGGFSHIRSKQPNISKGCKAENELIDGIGFRWYATPNYVGNGIGRVHSMLSFIWHLWRDGKKISVDFMPDVVIASSTYPMDIWPAQRIARMAGAKLVYEVHDLWPLSPMELGGFSRFHPFIVWIQTAEDYAYRNADKIVSMLPKAKNYMQTRGMDESKFIYIPNGIDDEDWASSEELSDSTQDRITSIKEKGLPVVGYAGTIGLSNALDQMLDVAKLMTNDANFVLVGDGPEVKNITSRIRNEGISNVYMLPPIGKKSIPKLLQNFDVLYIGWHKNPLYRFGISPNKLMDYMMSAKPVLHAVNAGNDPVAESGCGISVDNSNASDISLALKKILALSSSEKNIVGEKGRKYVIENNLYRNLAKKFINSVN